MDIIQKAQALKLPAGQYVIVGSGPLMARGLIDDANDVDLAVSPELYKQLQESGWLEEVGYRNKPVLRWDVFDAGIGYGEWDLGALLEDAFLIDGIAFMSLEKLLAWKKAAARSKDARHIELIEAAIGPGQATDLGRGSCKS